MNFDAPPKPSLLKVTIWIVAGLILLLLAIVFGGYYVVMHTAVPLRMMASAFSQAGEEEGGNFRIDGVTGSIAKGFKIRTIKWGTEGVDASQVDDVSVAYSSFWDLMGGRVVFKDIHIGKARLDVTGLEQMADEFSDNANMYSGTNWPGATNMAAWTNAMASRRYRAPPSSTRGRGFVQIDRLSIENVYVTNRSNGFSLSVPALQWKGFKAANGKVELGELKIDSDRLTVKTTAGEPVEIRGQKVSFQKKFEGTILPRLHPAVVQPMAFVIDAGYVRGALIWRLKAFDDRLEAGCLEDQKRFLMCSDLDIPAYIKGPLPSHLTVEMREASQGKGDAVKVSEGSFKLGMKEFKIEPSGLEKSETLGPARLVATSRAGDTIFTYSFIVPDQPWKMEQRLTAVPSMEPEEILARIFHDKSLAELTEDERKQVTVEKTGFGGWTPAKKEAAEQ